MAKSFGGKRDTDDDDVPKETPVNDRASELIRRAREESARRREISQRVADLVVNRIKHPPGFHRADGHYLWGNKYRVNVLTMHVEQDQPRLTIAKSFFVTSDGDEIVLAVPDLE